MTRAARLSRDAGFILLSTLLITGVIAAIALGLSLAVRNNIREMHLARDLVLARLHADNALVRAIAALGDPGDTMHGALLKPGASHIFRLNDVDVELSVEFESGKIDLNRAPEEFIRNALRAMASESVAEAMLARVMMRRARGEFIDDVNALLLPGQHFEPVAGMVARSFTVFTGARGIAPGFSLPQNLAAIPGITADDLASLQGQQRGHAETGAILMRHQVYMSPARAIYSIRAKVKDRILPPLRRRAQIAIIQMPVRRRGDLAVLGWHSVEWD